jgi:hypothetical protein
MTVSGPSLGRKRPQAGCELVGAHCEPGIECGPCGVGRGSGRRWAKFGEGARWVSKLGALGREGGTWA